ncbi:heterokaryon incompatibility protein-domain-containing protein [Rostrohypoxylon terebratum]|nr:heterokaryon incompatibility protein-domain-containing protein [Rostrohypoxylon terebratum]
MASQDYQKLPDPRSIRVIKLHSAVNLDDVIVFDLITVSLDATPPLSYNALSYTWGGQPLDQVVYANGKEFLVTENARNAMRRLRPYKAGRYLHLWIDAICINQQDNEEKSTQVQMMLEIYARTYRVQIWLGEEDETSPLIMKWLLWTGLMFHPLFYVRQWIEVTALSSIAPRKRAFFFTLLKGFDKLALWFVVFATLGPLLPFRALPIFKGFKRKIQAGVEDLAAREYWERSWTVQEASVNFNSRVICGSSKPVPIISFLMGHVIVGAFYVFFGLERIPLRYRLHLPTYSFYTGAGVLVHNMLGSLCKTKATLPVDKIFAIRALYPGSLGSMTVDYSRSVEDVFTEAARLILKGNKNVEFLRYACTGNRTDGFPSWVPAWDTPSVVPEQLSTFAPAMISPHPIVDQDTEPRVLKLKALRIDKVNGNISGSFPIRPPLQRQWAPSRSDSTNADEAFAIFRAWAVAPPNPNRDIRPKLRQFASLMVDIYGLNADQIFNWCPMIWESPDYGTGQQYGYVIAPPECHEARKFARYFLQLTSSRALFATESGRVGMSTAVVCEGDEVVLLSGERMPYLVRKCPGEPGKYTLVCPCWMSGAVKGEAQRSASGVGGEEDLGLDLDLEYIELV